MPRPRCYKNLKNIQHIGLHEALVQDAQLGHVDCISDLIGMGADVNKTTNTGSWNALLAAAHAGHAEIARLLLVAGSNPNISSGSGLTPLQWAAKEGHLEVAQVLLDHNALIEDPGGRFKSSALHRAAIKHQWEMVRFLVGSGADVNITERDGYTVLFRAVCANQWSMAQCLLEHNAEVTDRTGCHDETTIIHKTVVAGQLDVLRLLMRNGGSVNHVCNNRKLTPLHVAADKGHTDIVQYLIQEGAQIDMVDYNGLTALLRATLAKEISMETIKVLLDAGSDVNYHGHPASKLSTCLHQAVSRNRCDLLKMLLSYGASVNFMDFAGFQPIDIAVCTHSYRNDEVRNSLSVLKLLIGSGADPKFKNGYGRSALDWAILGNDREKIDFLQQHMEISLDLTLKNLARNIVRSEVMRYNQNSNNILLLPKLGLPKILESYLMFDYVDMDMT